MPIDRRFIENQFTIDDATDVRLGALAIGDVYVLDDASADRQGKISADLSFGASTGSFNVVGRARVPVTQQTKAPWRLIPYESLFLNGAVGTDAQVSTTITGNTLLRVDASALEIGIQTLILPSGPIAVTTAAVTSG
jgi:hypothetical protein